MDPTSVIGDVIASVALPYQIHVLVEPPEDFYVGRDDVYDQFTKPYHATAAFLKDSSEVNQLVDLIKQKKLTNASAAPFIVLENSIGMGKTQMAFNLMAHSDVEAFYITLTEDVTNLLVAFFGRSNGFVECVKRDLPEVGDAEVPDILAQPQLYVYGLIWAMLRGATIFRGPRTRQDVMRAMASREENGKTSVFFLDDFPSVDPLNRTPSTRKLRYMLNVFRSFGLAVVVTGASGVIQDLVRVAISSKKCDGLWCVVFPSIPKFHDPYVESIPGDLGRIISSSRPLFAELAVEYTKMTPYQSGTNLAFYLNQMVAAMAPKWEKYCKSGFFQAGQVRHFLADSYVVGPCRLGGYFARLEESEPFELWFRTRCGLVKGQGGTLAWQCRDALPLVHEDILLHLCLMGTKTCGVFRDCSSSPISFRRAVASVQDDRIFRGYSDAAVMKALVAGAIVAASHGSGYSGSSFGDFFSALLFELGLQNSPNVRVKFPDEVLDIVKDLMVPVLAPPNLEWPDFLLEFSLNLGCLLQTRVRDNVDISLLNGKVSVRCVVQNGPTTSEDMKRILGEIPSESGIHIVAASSLRNRYFKRSRSGDKCCGNFREILPASWHQAVFFHIGRLTRSAERDEAGAVWRDDLAHICGMQHECEESSCSDTGSRQRVRKLLIIGIIYKEETDAKQ